MTALQAIRPADLAGLRAVIAGADGGVSFIAGGTDLLVAPRLPPRSGLLVDISRTGGLAEIAVAGDTLRIGATATLGDLMASPAIRQHIPMLADAAGLCGSAQIRNRATIGGNVANAAPAGDLLPVLKCLGAEAVVIGRDGSLRTLAFEGLVIAANRTSLSPGELILRFEVPLASRLAHQGFVKLGPRDDLAIARLNLAMEADYDAATRRFGSVHLVAGAIGPVPLVLETAARVLAGNILGAASLDGFLASLLAAVDAAIPGRTSRPYKRRAVMGLGLDLLERVTGLADLSP